MKVLITGAAGQVGRALVAAAPAQFDVRAFSRAELDISDAGDVRAAVAVFRPAIIINAAAYTAVDKAEAEPELCAAINVEGPRNLAHAARAIPGCRLLQISTDYVFDGRSAHAYRPSDATNPLSVYGRTKLLGELAVCDVLRERAVVLRTAWVYAAQGKNFMLTMLKLMRERPVLRVVADQRGSPTSADSIAHALWAIAQRPDIHGVLHWTDAGEASWHEFAAAIGEEGVAAGLLSEQAHILPIVTADYPTAAHRPSNSVLDCSESIEQLTLTPAPWRVNLRATLASMH